MTKTVDLFIQSDQSIETVAETLARVTGWPVQPGGEAEPWSMSDGDRLAYLHTHQFHNDGALAFERYAFVLTAQVSGSRLTESPEAAMLRTVADRLREQRVPTMLVHDLEYRDREEPVAPEATTPEPLAQSEPS